MAAVRTRPSYGDASGDGEKDINDTVWSIPGKSGGEDHRCRVIPGYHAALLLYASPCRTESKR